MPATKEDSFRAFAETTEILPTGSRKAYQKLLKTFTLHVVKRTCAFNYMDFRASLSLAVPYTEDELSDLESIGKIIRFTPGSILFGEGEETDFALLIRKGHVKVVNGDRIVAVRGPRDMIGEMAAIRGKPRSASIFAIDEVEALFLPADAWLRFLMKHPRAALAGRYADDERVEQATRKIQEGELRATQRLAKALAELESTNIGACNDDCVILPVGQQDLSEYTGLSLAAVVKAIRLFKEKSVVATGRKSIRISDLEKLHKIARGDDIAGQI